MKLVVGLGNPGLKYKNTRHNLGFMSISYIADKLQLEPFKEKFHGEYSIYEKNGEKIIFFKPLTYMNLSGIAIREIVSFYKINIEDIIVIYDDKDLPFASLRLKEKGNPGSHNGMKNIVEQLQTISFKRIRIGIGMPPANMNMADFVLSKFDKNELEELNKCFEKVFLSINYFIDNNFNMAMNKYNCKENHGNIN